MNSPTRLEPLTLGSGLAAYLRTKQGRLDATLTLVAVGSVAGIILIGWLG